ncbi:Uma2 family endonuclease [Alkalinema pantanalense CENA528]|uniref:Uma2 family endonuclease n=1 Tax=Alkalinema pantanalense TaxID=1620705 RepID=UPI003D6F5AF5
MSIAQPKSLTLEEFLHYDDGTDTRYELVDGALVVMGAEHPLNPLIASYLFSIFLNQGIPYFRIVIGHQIATNSTKATARQPDLIIHSEASQAAILQDGRILSANSPAPLLVVEVVSNSLTDKTSWARDYQEKPSEYAERGIPEYWIIDPDRATVQIGTLTNGTYHFTACQGCDRILSPTFPTLDLTAEAILHAGQ